MTFDSNIFQRTELLLGKDYLEKAAHTKIILFGIGGVGSWCAEALIRAGIGHLTIVDSDTVNVTNINRQLVATTETVGRPKVEVMKERLLSINPDVNITALQEKYTPETHASFHIDTYDYIIDAIDSLSNKVFLIEQATQTDATFFSSMGAALRIDPQRIKVAEFWKVQGCPLGAALRSRIRKDDGLSKKFLCVYSDESRQNIETETSETKSEWDRTKAVINGTISYLPAMFGMTLASLVVQTLSQE